MASPATPSRWRIENAAAGKAHSKWNTSRSAALIGLWSGLDGMTSPMCLHHFWQISVAPMEAHCSSFLISA